MKKKLINMLSLVSLLCMSTCGKLTPPEPAENSEAQNQSQTAVSDKTIPAADVKEAPATELDRLIADTKDKVELKLWVPDEDLEITQSLIEDFKAECEGADLDITLEAKAEDDIYDTVSGDKAEVADVFGFRDALLPEYAAAGLLAEADSVYFNEDGYVLTKGAEKAVVYGEKTLAYPVSVYNGCFMYYDDAVLDESDMKSLEKMGEKLKAAGKKMAFEMDNAWYLYSFFGAEGSGLKLSISSDEVSNECNWNEKVGEDIANLIIDNVKNGVIEAVGSNSEAVEGFEKGKYAAMVSGPWSAEDIKGSVSGNLSATVLPTFRLGEHEVQMTSFAGYRLMGVNSSSGSSEWAKCLAEYLSSRNVQLKRYEAKGDCPAYLLTDADSIVAGDTLTKALNAQSDHAVPLRIGINYYAPAAMLGEALADGNTAGRSVKELLRKAVEGITSEVME